MTLLRRRKGGQDHAADVLLLQTQDELVVQFYFQEEELGLGPGISRADLMHAFERRHPRRLPQHLLRWARGSGALVRCAVAAGPL